MFPFQHFDNLHFASLNIRVISASGSLYSDGEIGGFGSRDPEKVDQRGPVEHSHDVSRGRDLLL